MPSRLNPIAAAAVCIMLTMSMAKLSLRLSATTSIFLIVVAAAAASTEHLKLASTVGIIFVFLSSSLPILFIWIYSCYRRRNDLQQQRQWAAPAAGAPGPSTERPLPALPLVPVESCGAMAAAAECVICLGEFEGGEDREAMVKVIPGCRHAFHPACIDRWLRSNVSCPLCRRTDLAVVAPVPEDLVRGDGGGELGGGGAAVQPTDRVDVAEATDMVHREGY